VGELLLKKTRTPSLKLCVASNPPQNHLPPPPIPPLVWSAPGVCAEVVFPFTRSVIMLNTDAHNPAIKAHKKMTKEQFLRNNRGLDSGHDLPKEFLERIYDR
jgi:Sec7-like guanine-nucleotide exchange factor